MSAIAKQFLLDILKPLQRVKSDLKMQIRFCKTHRIWALQPPELVSYVKDLESQLRDIEKRVYNIQLELEFVTPVKWRILVLHDNQRAFKSFLDVKPEEDVSHSRNYLFNYGKHKEFVEAAIDLGRSIAERKLHLVYGGGNCGLSKLVSEAAFVRESQVLGIIPRAEKPLGSLSDSPTGEELVISGDLATLEELITLAYWAHLHIHQKPIDLLNVNNFYDGFIVFLNYAIKNYFIPSAAKKLFICAYTANELLDLLQAYRPEPDPWTFVLECPNNDGNSSRSKNYKLDLTLSL
ncbi:hypothetical protein WN943_003543 [Citrus x changshan-huyou]